MNLTDLSRPVDSRRVSDLINTQFGTDYNIKALSLNESVTLLNKTGSMIAKFKRKGNLHESQNNASYMKLIMLKEAAEKRVGELVKSLRLQESHMNKKFLHALKIAALGGSISESHLKRLKVSESMQAVLRNKGAAQAFMKKIVENQKAKRNAIMEGEIDQAQTTIAAQDIANQIQDMIAKFADIKYKELPALHDSIRNSQGTDAAEQFNSSLVGSLDLLTSSLETAKKDVNNAIAVLTGQEVAGEGDLNLDDFDMGDEGGDLGDEGGDLGDMGDEGEDTGDEFDLDFETDDSDVDLGRARR